VSRMPYHDNPTDEELALSAQRGSEKDFDVLVDRYTPAVYRLARGITGGPQDAEDVVQETFLRAFKHLDSFAPSKATFKTWLLTIARNQSINVFGSLKRRTLRFLSDFDIDERGPDVSDNPFSNRGMDTESLLVMKQEYSRVERALHKVPERQRTAMLLKAQEDMSYDQIAGVMNTSVSSVESLIFRGRKRLLEILED
jgi:RNA polymerase sigma-70 factor, ECF subfamily